jgi:hypothetical protein
VYQLAGCNIWKVCTPHNSSSAGEVPLSDSERAERVFLEERVQAFRGPWDKLAEDSIENHATCAFHAMKAGDAQYLPRAMFHFAEATPCDGPSGGQEVAGLPQGSSIHLTVGIHRKGAEWVDLLESTGGMMKLAQSDLQHNTDERNGIAKYARSLPPWRRQMPTWALREGSGELLGEWRSNLKLLRQHIEIHQPSLATPSTLTWLLSLNSRAALHSAILVWQQQRAIRWEEQVQYDDRRESRRLGSSSSCYIGEPCSAGYYGQWTSDAGHDDGETYEGYCNDSCDSGDNTLFDSYDESCDSGCDNCRGCYQ